MSYALGQLRGAGGAEPGCATKGSEVLLWLFVLTARGCGHGCATSGSIAAFRAVVITIINIMGTK